MNKISLIAIGLFILLACKYDKKLTSIELTSDSEIITKYSNTITEEDAKKHVYTLASDSFEGRKTGERGQKLAAEYLANYYNSLGIKGINGADNYFQIIPADSIKLSDNATENVLAFIKGTEKPNEIIIISSHYDHEGIKNGVFYPGADDNASGTSAVLEIAQAFATAKKDGYGPKRSILFLNFTGEEDGLLGSKYYVKNPVYPLENIVAGLNIDMVGRIGKKREPNDDNYVYIIGADRLSSELHSINECANEIFINLTLDYKYNDPSDPNKFYTRSDHYNLAKNGIPIIFYFNGTHADYHKPTDTADKINYPLLTKRTKLVFFTAWELANREERIRLDEVIVETKK